MEINGKAKEVFEVKDKVKEKKAKEIMSAMSRAEALTGIAVTSNYGKFLREILAAALDLPQLLTKTEAYFQPLSIIRDIVSDSPNIPFLVLHGQKKLGLGLQGQEFDYYTKSVLATDEEIESCLDNLTADQLKFILRSPVFEPFLADLFEQTTELVPETSEVPQMAPPPGYGTDEEPNIPF